MRYIDFPEPYDYSITIFTKTGKQYTDTIRDTSENRAINAFLNQLQLRHGDCARIESRVILPG